MLVWLTFSSAQFVFVLLTETVTNREEIPATLLVHIPHVRFLACILCVRFIDQMHEEEPKTYQIVSDNIILLDGPCFAIYNPK